MGEWEKYWSHAKKKVPSVFKRFKRGNLMVRNVVGLTEDMAIRTSSVVRMIIETMRVSINLERMRLIPAGWILLWVNRVIKAIVVFKKFLPFSWFLISIPMSAVKGSIISFPNASSIILGASSPERPIKGCNVIMVFWTPARLGFRIHGQWNHREG